MSSPLDVEPQEPVKHAPPTVLLLFTLMTGIGVVVAGAWIINSVAIIIIGSVGILAGALGLRYARHL